MERRLGVTIVVVALALLVASAVETFWRFLHSSYSSPVIGPGWYSAEVRHLPEGSVLPYGTGVFLYPRFFPVRSLSATLVFAGYCGDSRLNWKDAGQLHINCELAEGEPAVLVPAVGTTRILASVAHRGGS